VIQIPIVALLLAAPVAQPSSGGGFLCLLPAEARARLEFRDRYLGSLPATTGNAPSYVIASTKRWSPGSTLTVAFRGGSDLLRADIAAAAQRWVQFGNLKLSFKNANGAWLEWAPTDTTPAADIRVGFSERGYWSYVGTDSRDPIVSALTKPSLNLQQFDIERPGDWRTVVIHEFGHAIGFEHEHQNPVGGCDDQFRWYDDPGYQYTRNVNSEFIPDPEGHRPGLYTLLGGPPNRWDRAMVDQNLRQLPDSHAYEPGDFDAHSIMMYAFPAWMFVTVPSRCYSVENEDLSEKDREGAARAYPAVAAQAAAILAAQRKAYERLLEQPSLMVPLAQHYRSLLEAAQPKR